VAGASKWAMGLVSAGAITRGAFLFLAPPFYGVAKMTDFGLKTDAFYNIVSWLDKGCHHPAQ